MKVIIDRFEEGRAVVELPDKTFAVLPASLFEGGREGDVYTIAPDPEETRTRKEVLARRLKDLMGEP